MPQYTGYIGPGQIMYQQDPATVVIYKTENGAYVGPMTLASNEYPTGILLSGLFMGDGPSADATVYLSNADGTIKCTLGAVHTNAARLVDPVLHHFEYDSIDASQLNKSGQSGQEWRNLAGATLAIRREGSGLIHVDVGKTIYITITTAYTDWPITVNQAGGGTVTASAAKALVGTQISLEVKPNTGYQLSGWTKTPADLAITNNSFTMPDQAVVLTPQWSKANYAITRKVSPAGAGTVTAAVTAQYGDQVNVSQTPADGYTFQRWELSSGGTVTDGHFTMPAKAVTLTAVYSRNSYVITKATNPAGAGVITAPGSAGYGDQISISQVASTGFTFLRWELSTGTPVTSNSFTMPNGPVTLTAVYQRNIYQITAKVSPAGAGVITVSGTAGYGDQVTVSQRTNEGYYFDGWTLSNGGKVTNGAFTMPDGSITVTARYLRRSVGSLNKTRLQGGTNVTLAITSESAAYTHKYRINFGTGMDTGWVNVAARTNSVSIMIPKEWANQIPTTQSKSGGTVTLQTYRGTDLIGTWESGGLTYEVPADAVPTIGAISTSILRTVDSITYANIGNIYVQGHCGVTVTVAAGIAKYQANITTTKIWIESYTGGKYSKTILNNGGTWNSGLLDRSGATDIFIQLTDSRGLSSTTKQTIQVTAYAGPNITLFDCKRVNDNGEDDPLGEKGKYEFAYNWTEIGSNAVTRKISVGGNTATNPAGSGWLLPSGRLVFDKLRSYEITLEVYDLFEKARLTYQLGSGKYMMHFAADGNSMAFGHAVEHTRSSTNYDGTFEVDGKLEFYYGNKTLKEYIQDVINGNV